MNLTRFLTPFNPEPMVQSADDVRDSMTLFRSVRGGASPTSALQLQITRCNVHRAIELNALWHSRLPQIDWTNVVRAPPAPCFVAEFNDIAFASAIWSAPIAPLLNGLNWIELRRLAIADDAPPNTASRMLRVMRLKITREWPEIVRMISYQDTEVHTGTIYRAAGWLPTARSDGGGWQRPSRRRNAAQSLSPKIRWEYNTKGTHEPHPTPDPLQP